MAIMQTSVFILLMLFISTGLAYYIRSKMEMASISSSPNMRLVVHQELLKRGVYIIEEVVDGNTLKFSNIRMPTQLFGINCPKGMSDAKRLRNPQELNQDVKPVDKIGQEATDFLKELFKKKVVRLEYDIQNSNKYGKILAYVFVPICSWQDGSPACTLERKSGYEYVLNRQGAENTWEIFVNATMIKSGYSSIEKLYLNAKYADLFLKLCKEARENKRGIWREPEAVDAETYCTSFGKDCPQDEDRCNSCEVTIFSNYASCHSKEFCETAEESKPIPKKRSGLRSPKRIHSAPLNINRKTAF